ncbi:MAG: formylglycine-generating enzyme family protein, partial [Planctomycetota bacterium]
MGSPKGEGDDYEHPRHPVRITPFLLQTTPVTRRQYALFDARYEAVEAAFLSQEANASESPAIDISWYDAFVFALWSGGRLPTEAEWEFACRAGMETRYSFGDDVALLGEYGWYAHNSGSTTHAVGQRKSNKWGLYDMHGNVWEWCSDWFDGSYYAKSAP